MTDPTLSSGSSGLTTGGRPSKRPSKSTGLRSRRSSKKASQITDPSPISQPVVSPVQEKHPEQDYPSESRSEQVDTVESAWREVPAVPTTLARFSKIKEVRSGEADVAFGTTTPTAQSMYSNVIDASIPSDTLRLVNDSHRSKPRVKMADLEKATRDELDRLDASRLSYDEVIEGTNQLAEFVISIETKKGRQDGIRRKQALLMINKYRDEKLGVEPVKINPLPAGVVPIEPVDTMELVGSSRRRRGSIRKHT